MGKGERGEWVRERGESGKGREGRVGKGERGEWVRERGESG